MNKRLVVHSAAALIRIGRRILCRLRVDPRMAAAIAVLEAAQESLEAKQAAWEAASKAAATAGTERRRARLALSNTLREFGFTLLSVTGNHHNVDPYLRYFHEGYGAARILSPPLIIEFTRILLVKLEEEPDPKIAAARPVLAVALEEMVNAEAGWEATAAARTDAFGVLRSEKSNWARGLALSRAMAEWGCMYDHPVVRQLYAPARRNSSPEELQPEVPVESGEGPETALAIDEGERAAKTALAVGEGETAQETVFAIGEGETAQETMTAAGKGVVAQGWNKGIVRTRPGPVLRGVLRLLS